MATDRMYLVCECGSEFALARYLMPPWYAYDNLTEQLTVWLDEHQHCDPGNYPAKPQLIYGSDGPPPEKVVAYMTKVLAGEIKMGAAL